MIAQTLVFVAVVATAFGAVCQNPTITSETFTTTDAFFHQATTFIATFTVKCANGGDGVSLFAEVDGRTMPVAVGEESAKYQVTWSEEHDVAASGTHTITLYDEDNYAQLRKAQRNNEDRSKVTAFGTISLYHAGASRGRFIASETLGVIGAIALFYTAFQYRSGITN